MKILVVSQYYYPEQFKINDICEGLLKEGHDVTVLTGLPNYPTGVIPREYKRFKKRDEVVNGVKVLRCFEVGRGTGKIKLMLNYISFMISASLKVLTLKSDYDVVYVFQLSPVTMAIPAIVYKLRHKKKLFLYCQDLWPESLKALNISEKSVIYRVINRLSQFIYKQCDEIGVTSKSFSQYINEKHGVDKNRITYHPQHAEELFLKVNGKSEDNNVIDFLFAGNVGQVQDIDIILKAVKEIKSIDNFHVHFVGDGSYLEAAKSLSRKLDIEGKVTFYGRYPVSKMSEFYILADVFLLTLKGGTFLSNTVPSKLQGYMAAGKPIVGAIDGAASQLIHEVGCGECVKAGDYVLLANTMKKCIENYSVFKSYGTKGNKYFIENFTLDVYLENLNHSFKRIL